MSTILVVVEQREGKLNRVSWETLTAGQALAAETGWTLEAAVVGSGASGIANEVAGKKVAKVYDIESAQARALHSRCFCGGAETVPGHASGPAGADAAYLPGARLRSQARHRHGPQRDQRCIGYKKEGEKLLFTRQMFQGKLAADVSFASEAP